MAPEPLSNLVAAPFGPYLDSEALTDACKTAGRTNLLVLRDVMLEWGGRPTGLTECEPSQHEYDQSRKNVPVRFRGILEIKSLAWLTTLAKKRIEKALRERDIQSSITEGTSRSRHSTLTLGTIYASNKRIKLWIQGTRHMPCVYLHSRLVPNGLTLHSKDKERTYEILSMDINTYLPSRAYLARYRLLKVLKDLIDLDAQTNSRYGDKTTPVSERTPQWFVEVYRTHMASPVTARKRRLVYTSSDSDIEHSSSSDSSVTRHAGRILRRGREHTLRHLSRAEVFSLLAAHADWILQDQEGTQRPILNRDAWRAWIPEVRRSRRDAERDGVRWGIWEEHRTFSHLQNRDSDADDDEPLPAVRKRRARPRQQQRQGQSHRQPQTRRAQARTIASASRSTTLPDDDEPMPDEPAARTYDSDFSPASTPPYSPSSSSAASRPPTPPNPEVMRLIPVEFFYPPLLPTGSMRWFCPVRDCSYMLDLLALSAEDVAPLSAEEAQRLRAGGWFLRDVWVIQCFDTMVSAHYMDHLDRSGLMLCQEGKRWKVLWKKPQHHPPWPPERVMRHRMRVAPSRAKREDQ
ncbi:hypothetical protein B0H21DRAFT_723022 [Amylocystis lapponica]|nr:hypothetical protein B0H21DRAFT_723022 [Amylocystis lapponica]